MTFPCIRVPSIVIVHMRHIYNDYFVYTYNWFPNKWKDVKLSPVLENVAGLLGVNHINLTQICLSHSDGYELQQYALVHIKLQHLKFNKNLNFMVNKFEGRVNTI